MANKKQSSLRKMASKINPYSTVMSDENNIAHIRGWLDTGFYALNAILSGDLYKGLPYGRVVTLFGESQSGKSLTSALAQKFAQEQGMEVILFDTEFDKDGRMEANFKVNLDDVITMPIDTIEELTIQFTKMLQEIIDNEEFGQYLFVLDSVGFLGSEKELKDVMDKNNVAMDMGLKAKMLKTFFRNIKGKLARSQCPFLMINHETGNPNALHESIFKTQGGGKAIEYISSSIINVAHKKEKVDKSNPLDIETVLAKKNYSGQMIRFFSQKSRLCQPHKEVECYLNFETGPDKYSGLKPLIEQLIPDDILYLKSAKGEIGKGRTWYLKKGDEEIKLGEYKEWCRDPEIMEKEILPTLNPYINDTFKYKTQR